MERGRPGQSPGGEPASVGRGLDAKVLKAMRRPGAFVPGKWGWEVPLGLLNRLGLVCRAGSEENVVCGDEGDAGTQRET